MNLKIFKNTYFGQGLLTVGTCASHPLPRRSERVVISKHTTQSSMFVDCELISTDKRQRRSYNGYKEMVYFYPLTCFCLRFLAQDSDSRCCFVLCYVLMSTCPHKKLSFSYKCSQFVSARISIAPLPEKCIQNIESIVVYERQKTFGDPDVIDPGE